MRKILIAIMDILLLVSCLISVNAEESWTCPECGREGNTGKFCGSCAYPSPQPADGTEVRIDKASFPDKAFRKFVTGFDKNDDKTLSAGELAAVKTIDCSEKGIGSLKGIEYFTALEELNCKNNKLTEIDVSNNTRLRILNVGYNQLTDLALDNVTLTELYVSKNQIANLDISRCVSLKQLKTTGNQLDVLDISRNKKLEVLFCNSNNLTELDTSANTELRSLECSMNKIGRLDLANNKKLERIRCYKNQFAELNIRNCSNLIKARDRGEKTVNNGTTQILYRVPGRSETQNEADIDTVRDTNYYGIEIDNATKLVEFICFGHYEQDYDETNGKEPIEWIVIDRDGNQGLLISRYALHNQPFHQSVEKKRKTWDECTLRSWLNGEFFSEAFSAKERDCVITTTLKNSTAGNRSGWIADNGKDTRDKVFILDYNELCRYFPSAESRRCQATAYTMKAGAWWTKSDIYTRWMLRSRGKSTTSVAYVDNKGNIVSQNNNLNNAIRPAIWVDLTKVK